MEFSTSWLWLENSFQSKVISRFLGAWDSWSMILHLSNENFNSYVRIFGSDHVCRWKDRMLPNISSLFISLVFKWKIIERPKTDSHIFPSIFPSETIVTTKWIAHGIRFPTCLFCVASGGCFWYVSRCLESNWISSVMFGSVAVPLQLNDACYKIKPFVNAISYKHTL